MQMYLAIAVLTALFQWSFVVSSPAVGTNNSSWHWIKFPPGHQLYPIGILFLRAVINNWIAVSDFSPRSQCMLYVVVCHDKHSVRSFLPCFIVSLCHSPKVLAECSLPHLSRGGIVHQFFVTQNCFPGHWIDHRVGVVLKFVDNWDDCMFDVRSGCEDWLVGSFLTDGENIYCLL